MLKCKQGMLYCPLVTLCQDVSLPDLGTQLRSKMPWNLGFMQQNVISTSVQANATTGYEGGYKGFNTAKQATGQGESSCLQLEESASGIKSNQLFRETWTDLPHACRVRRRVDYGNTPSLPTSEQKSRGRLHAGLSKDDKGNALHHERLHAKHVHVCEARRTGGTPVSSLQEV